LTRLIRGLFFYSNTPGIPPLFIVELEQTIVYPDHPGGQAKQG
jgi:hypothetical protein